MASIFNRSLLGAACLQALLVAACTEPGQTELARGNVLASRKQFDEAVAAYQAAAEAAPKRARPRELKGHVLFDLGRAEQARRAYEEAISVEPQGALEAKIGIARLDADQGKLDDAIARISEILVAHPDNLYALLSRANLSIRRGAAGDAEQAISDTAQAYRIDSDNPSVLYTRGNAFLAAGKREEALQTFALLDREAPSSPLADYGRARIAAAQKDKLETLARLRGARQKAGAGPTGWKAAEVKDDPAFGFLRADPDFVEVVGVP